LKGLEALAPGARHKGAGQGLIGQWGRASHHACSKANGDGRRAGRQMKEATHPENWGSWLALEPWSLPPHPSHSSSLEAFCSSDLKAKIIGEASPHSCSGAFTPKGPSAAQFIKSSPGSGAQRRNRGWGSRGCLAYSGSFLGHSRTVACVWGKKKGL
jgi:hypothetical protein